MSTDGTRQQDANWWVGFCVGAFMCFAVCFGVFVLFEADRSHRLYETAESDSGDSLGQGMIDALNAEQITLESLLSKNEDITHHDLIGRWARNEIAKIEIARDIGGKDATPRDPSDVQRYERRRPRTLYTPPSRFPSAAPMFNTDDAYPSPP